MIAAVLASLSVALATGAVAPRPRARTARSSSPSGTARPAMATAGALGLVMLLSRLLGWPTGIAVGLGILVIGLQARRRTAPHSRRADDAAVSADLPHLVGLLADALRSGLPPGVAVDEVTSALPGPAAARMTPVAQRLRLGMDPQAVWEAVITDSALAPLGRAMARASATGASVLAAVERLATDLAETGRHEAESAARAVGVKAAAPLGLCLLPAFVVIGIIPVVATVFADLLG